MGSATILGRFGEDKYPIGRFILDRARALGLSRTDLVRRLGYRDLAGGHKALSATLLTGVIAPLIEHHLAGALKADETLVRAVIASTRQQERDEARRMRNDKERAYRASFRPHLQVQTKRIVPSPIFVAALLTVARLRIIRLPDEAIKADNDAPRPHDQDHHSRPLARHWWLHSSIRRHRRLRPGRDGRRRRFRFWFAVPCYWRSSRGYAEGRATG